MKRHDQSRTALVLASAFVVSVAAPAPADTVRYKINARQSSFLVKTFKGGLFKALGHNHTIAIRNFSGEVRLTPGTMTPASLKMTIKAASLAAIDPGDVEDHPKIEKEMRTNVLETDKYPDIVFKSVRVTSGKGGGQQRHVKIRGDLTLHGVTRPISMDADVTLKAKSLHARGEFPLRQTDYGIKPTSAAGGTIRVKDEVKLAFDIVAER